MLGSERPTTSQSQGAGRLTLSIDPTDHARRQLAFDLPSVQWTMPCASLVRPFHRPNGRCPGVSPPFSARKCPPPSVPLVGGGQSLATGKFRSRSPEQSERGAGDRDRTLSRFCPTQKSKNFVSRARSRSAALRGSFRLGPER